MENPWDGESRTMDRIPRVACRQGTARGVSARVGGVSSLSREVMGRVRVPDHSVRTPKRAPDRDGAQAVRYRKRGQERRYCLLALSLRKNRWVRSAPGAPEGSTPGVAGFKPVTTPLASFVACGEAGSLGSFCA